jgi:DNA mismatch repair protein MutL
VSTARIQQLSPRLANQIAAGEVVERPASVVKELLENSLDAGATRIDIEIERGGIQLIRINDNGDGIHPDDLPLALARHATSKIATIDDLAAVMSLGFRGEALASIASVAKLLLVSRRRGETSAWQAFAEGAGMQVQVQPAALGEGTRIDVRDLFFNTPARRRFLRSEATEFAHIDEVVRRVALARPDVAISLKHNGRGVRQLRASRDDAARSARVAAVLGRSFMVTAVPVETRIDTLQLHGFVGHPNQHRAQADGQYVFVNGRAIRDRVVSHAIRAGFAERIPAGRSPCYALFLELPASEVDVNVHPTKHEVRFRNARWLHDWLTRTVSEAVQQAGEQIDMDTGEVLPASRSASASAFALTTSAVNETRSSYHDRSCVPATSNAPISSAMIARSSLAATPPFVAASPVANAALPVQRVSAALVLQWASPPRLWQAQDLLSIYLQQQWCAQTAPAVLPLLLPIAVATQQLSAATHARLQALGFALRDNQLMAAPALLRGADWSRLFDELSVTDEQQIAAQAAAHLLQQTVSQHAAFWQPVIDWAMQQSPAVVAQQSKLLTEVDWSALWSR